MNQDNISGELLQIAKDTLTGITKLDGKVDLLDQKVDFHYTEVSGQIKEHEEFRTEFYKKYKPVLDILIETKKNSKWYKQQTSMVPITVIITVIVTAILRKLGVPL